MMKSIYTVNFAVVLFVASLVNFNSKQTVRVSNLQNKSGRLFIAWYSTAESFPGKDPDFTKEIDIKNQSEVNVTFDNIPDGRYGISIYLDANNNGKFDTNFMGIPKEKYGFSNNVLPAMRAANFEEAAFEIQGKSTVISIRLK